MGSEGIFKHLPKGKKVSNVFYVYILWSTCGTVGLSVTLSVL